MIELYTQMCMIKNRCFYVLLYWLKKYNLAKSTAFQNSYFEKDNDTSSGTKGDFIFKEEDN